MATQRYISTSFWDDEWVHGLDPSEKLLYLYLMTCPLTNIAGAYKITVSRICFDTGYNDSTVKHILDKFKEAGKAYLFKGYIILPSWPKHQNWEKSGKVKEGIERILGDMDTEVKEYMMAIGYRYPIEGVQVGSELLLTLNSNSNLNSDLSTAPAKAETDPLFRPILDSFLSMTKFSNYPKEMKLTKGLCKAIRNLSPDSPEDAARLILETYRTLTQGQERFWKDQPFTPSGLSPNLDRVWAIANKKAQASDLSWIDAVRRGA